VEVREKKFLEFNDMDPPHSEPQDLALLNFVDQLTLVLIVGSHYHIWPIISREFVLDVGSYPLPLWVLREFNEEVKLAKFLVIGHGTLASLLLDFR
jgi:hypothetical protein